jgi:hypothetical protein
MGDEETREETPPFQYMIPLPYAECDALFDFYFCMRNQDTEFKVSRFQRTIGSSIYSFDVPPSVLGRVCLIQADTQTYCLIAPSPKEPKKIRDIYTLLLTMMIGRFWVFCVQQYTIYKDLPSIERAPSGDGTSIAELLAELPRQTKPSTKPQRGAPIDAWLDWRDAERKRNRRVSLEEIAEESGFSISTVKKASAFLKPRKPR